MDRHLLRANDFSDARYPEPLDVPMLTRAVQVSLMHFSREFRSAFGETPDQHLLTRRLERTAALEHTTHRGDLPRRRPAQPRLVHHSFTRAYGVPPAAYRAAHPPAARLVPVPTCMQQAWGRPASGRFREDTAPQP